MIKICNTQQIIDTRNIPVGDHLSSVGESQKIDCKNPSEARPSRINRAIYLTIAWYPVVPEGGFHPSAFPSPIRPAGANSIHGFITVQITTIYLRARTNVRGDRGERNERIEEEKEEDRGRARGDGQPPCIQKYFTLTALRGIG